MKRPKLLNLQKQLKDLKKIGQKAKNDKKCNKTLPKNCPLYVGFDLILNLCSKTWLVLNYFPRQFLALLIFSQMFWDKATFKCRLCKVIGQDYRSSVEAQINSSYFFQNEKSREQPRRIIQSCSLTIISLAVERWRWL